jgi:hypothetical protein
VFSIAGEGFLVFLEHSQWVCQKSKSTQIWLISPKNGSQWKSYTLGWIEKCYNVKAFMPYTVHWANEYFIISFFLSHLFILFSLTGLSLSLAAVSLSLFLLLLVLIFFFFL